MRLLLVLLILIPHWTLAQPLLPFEAEYRIHVSRIPTPIKATLALVHGDSDNQFQMSFQTRSLMMRNREESTFQWNSCSPRSESYTHEFRGFGVRREHRMDFNWKAREVHYQGGEGDIRYPISNGVLDELTMLLKAQCLFAEGLTQFTMKAAYGPRVRNHHFVVTGEELVRTPAGDVQTLVVEKRRREDSERRTIFWVAPSLQYMLVKARHIESRGLFGELLMRSYEGPAPDESVIMPVRKDDASQEEEIMLLEE